MLKLWGSSASGPLGALPFQGEHSRRSRQIEPVGIVPRVHSVRRSGRLTNRSSCPSCSSRPRWPSACWRRRLLLPTRTPAICPVPAARLRLGFQAVPGAQDVVVPRVELEPQGREPVIRGVGYPAVAARTQDAHARFGLQDQSGDADRLGPGLHQEPLRHSREGLGVLAAASLVLSAGVSRFTIRG
jgi:hypothetical protein